MAPLVLATCVAAAPARAADPGRWTVTGTTTLPLLYYQGVTVDPARNFYFDGIFVGLYRTDPAFTETGRTDDVIPPDVHVARGLQPHRRHQLGPREGGRVLLPLECYVPGGPNGGNPCLHGSIGVADPGTLQWRYYVKLDPAEIPKAMWNEVSPDGTLLWTSSGDDLLAYRTADISPANAAPGARADPLGAAAARRRAAERDHGRDLRRRPDVRRRAGRQDVPRLVDRPRHRRARARDRAHDRRRVRGPRHRRRSRAARCSWLIQPFNDEQKPPTYSPDHATLLSFGPARAAAARGPRRRAPAPGARRLARSCRCCSARARRCCGAAASPRRCCAPTAAPRRWSSSAGGTCSRGPPSGRGARALARRARSSA